MAFIGDAALAKLLDLLLVKSIDAALNFVADHKQVYDQLKEWKSKWPDQSCAEPCRGEADQGRGCEELVGRSPRLAYDVDDILDEFAYEELRLKLQKTQAQASTKGTKTPYYLLYR
ncbi:hypothetical protein GQ457_13G000030 [Hibiscus cannabinus]